MGTGMAKAGLTFAVLLRGGHPQLLEVLVCLRIHHQEPGFTLPGFDVGNNLRVPQPLHVYPIHLQNDAIRTQTCAQRGWPWLPDPPLSLRDGIFPFSFLLG